MINSECISWIDVGPSGSEVETNNCLFPHKWRINIRDSSPIEDVIESKATVHKSDMADIMMEES